MDITRNYFEFLGVPVSFDVDQARLAECYRDLQKQLHPDRHSHQSEREQRLAVQYTAYLNEALATLKSPLKRAQYLLSLKGIDTLSDSSNQLDPMFLMEQMELRERAAEAVEHDDPEAELDALQAYVSSDFKQLQQSFAVAWEAGELEQAELLVRKMQFSAKLQSDIEALEDRLFDD
ncbi:Fe-S protein assembly co-chaperone HscB [Marinobacterium weihaiense]|uniref:Co-chaperone protein HscB homolog n=1 Tax=Marinobacterium weihaiense TaxID=2851016 RepID=A0ABS6MCS1_9GAMM|nr:Fe-S protein assembly co-chaperone HscB [Marinobacterium weihaiense]MBV0934085.1 Fe-S protein assembly co-chaperone HscB [Marinobacterium weihaiense]